MSQRAYNKNLQLANIKHSETRDSNLFPKLIVPGGVQMHNTLLLDTYTHNYTLIIGIL